MQDKTASTDHPIHPMLASRWSPRAFSARLLDGDTIASMFEAARWSPSANNLQPWAFIYAERAPPRATVQPGGVCSGFGALSDVTVCAAGSAGTSAS